MIMRNLLFIFLFFLKIFVVKSADDPIKEGRYCVFDEGNFNIEFLKEVKNYLKENKKEIFYLFPVEEAHLVDPKVDIKEQKTKENIIYYSKGNFVSELFKLYVNPKNFIENNEDCGYINNAKGNLELKKYIKCHTLEGKEVYKELKCLSILDKGNVMKNSKNDQPVIFELMFNDGTEKSYFCSNIGIISDYLSGKSKKLSLFKNNNIKAFIAVLFLKVKNYFDNMFYDCNNLKTIFFEYDKQIYIDGDSLFEGCINLELIKPLYKVLNTKKSNFVFKNCKNLINVYVNKDFIFGDYCFEECEKLKDVFSTDNTGRGNNKDYCSIVSTGCFKNCFSLKNVSYYLDFAGDPRELFYGCKSLKEIVISIDLCNDKDYSFKDMFYGVKCNNGVKINFRTEDPDFRIPKEKITAMFNGCKIPNDKIKFVIYNTKNPVDTQIQGYENFLKSKFVSNEDDTLGGQGYYKEKDEKSTKNISDSRFTLKESDKIKKVKKSIENGSKIGNSCLNCCCFKCCCTEKN